MCIIMIQSFFFPNDDAKLFRVSGPPTYPAPLMPKPLIGSSSVPEGAYPSLSAPRWTSRLLASRNPVRKISCRHHLMSSRSRRWNCLLLPGSFVPILPSVPFQLLYSSVRPFCEKFIPGSTISPGPFFQLLAALFG
jgi:hypothetical protein